MHASPANDVEMVNISKATHRLSPSVYYSLVASLEVGFTIFPELPRPLLIPYYTTSIPIEPLYSSLASQSSSKFCAYRLSYHKPAWLLRWRSTQPLPTQSPANQLETSPMMALVSNWNMSVHLPQIADLVSQVS